MATDAALRVPTKIVIRRDDQRGVRRELRFDVFALWAQRHRIAHVAAKDYSSHNDSVLMGEFFCALEPS